MIFRFALGWVFLLVYDLLVYFARTTGQHKVSARTELLPQRAPLSIASAVDGNGNDNDDGDGVAFGSARLALALARSSVRYARLPFRRAAILRAERCGQGRQLKLREPRQ